LVLIPVLVRALRIATLILLTLLVPALVALLLLIPGLALVLLIGARWVPALVILVLLIAILPLLVLVLVAVGHSVSPMDDASTRQQMRHLATFTPKQRAIKPKF
jgi:hypothetical protein